MPSLHSALCSTWIGGRTDRNREESLWPQIVGWYSGRVPSLLRTWQVRVRKGAELPPRGEAMGKGDCTGKTAPWEGHRPPRGIPDAVDTGSISIKIHFKPPWTVALRFCSISCLGYKSTLSFVPEMGPSCRQNS